MPSDTDDRPSLPAVTILILFLSLLVVTPLAAWRWAQQLASPAPEVILLEDDGDRFRGHWRVGEVEYRIEEGIDEARSTGTLTLSVTLPPGEDETTDVVISVEASRDGSIEKVLFLDPDGDHISNVFVCVRSAGSGSYLQMFQYALSIDGVNSEGTWSNLTAIPEHLSVGYMGHDTIERQSEMLVRTFPIYLDGDSNSEPTGGTRSLIWDFREGRWKPDPRQ